MTFIGCNDMVVRERRVATPTLGAGPGKQGTSVSDNITENGNGHPAKNVWRLSAPVSPPTPTMIRSSSLLPNGILWLLQGSRSKTKRTAPGAIEKHCRRCRSTFFWRIILDTLSRLSLFRGELSDRAMLYLADARAATGT